MIPFRRTRSAPAARADRGVLRGWERAERGADRTADAVLDRDGRDHRDGPAGRRPHAEVPPAGAPASVPGNGRPLDPARLAFFERRLGADLSTVRVHDDAAAARAARDEHARAYTFGEHVVLGADADHAVLAHELAHVLQQRSAGRAAVQRQDQPRGGGVGRVPPAVDFDVVRERAPAEDARALFGHDSVSLAGLDLTPLIPRLGTNRPLIVDVDGYASTEGDPDYNLNLSAHRAAAIRAVLVPLLPEGSTVRLHAHGSTTEFGEPAANRRVGIRVVEAPVALAPPSIIPPGGLGYGGRPRLLPDLQLRLDPSLTPLPPGLLPPGLLPPGVLPPIPDVRLRDPITGEPAPRPFEATPVLPPLLPGVAPLPTVPPIGPIRPTPQLFPRLVPQESVVDWGSLRQTFTDHGAGAIDPRMADAAESFTRDWYQRYRALGLPEERARQLANAGTRAVVGRELAREGNTAVDRFDNELRRQGLPTPIGGSVDLLDLMRRIRGERGGRR